MGNDIDKIKAALPVQYFPNVSIYVIRDNSCKIVAFIGIAGNMVEMLFVSPDCHGCGYGSKLMDFAVDNGVNRVDVNEQNERAYKF